MLTNIVIISDFHLGTNDDKGVYGTLPNGALLDDIGINKLQMLKNALGQRYSAEKIDLLIFLGDYTTGCDDADKKEKSFNNFLSFLNDIEGMPYIFRDSEHIRDHIIVLPGNHDVQRGGTEPLKNFKEHFKEYVNPFRTKSGGIFKLGSPTFVYDDQKLLISCLSTVNNSATEVADITRFIQMVEENKTLNKIDKEQLLNYLKSQKVKDIPTINSKTVEKFALLCSENLENYKDYKKVVVSHHPLISGIESTLAVKEYPNTIGGYRFFETALCYGYKYFVHGHIHAFSCIELFNHANNSSLPAFHIGVPDFLLDSRGIEPQILELTLTEDNNDTIKLLRLDSITQGFKEGKFVMTKDISTEEGVAMGDAILVDFEIEQLIKEAEIIINADSSRIEAASYDCALSPNYKRAQGGSYRWENVQLEPVANGAAQICLNPNDTVLIYTEEEFNIPDNMVLHASPISSWARNGLRVEISHFVDPGFKGAFCFPVTNITDHDLYIGSHDPIMSVEFVRLSKKVKTSWSDKHPTKVTARKNKTDQ